MFFFGGGFFVVVVVFCFVFSFCPNIFFKHSSLTKYKSVLVFSQEKKMKTQIICLMTIQTINTLSAIMMLIPLSKLDISVLSYCLH